VVQGERRPNLFEYAEPYPTVAIVISLTIAKLLKIIQTTKHFPYYFRKNIVNTFNRKFVKKNEP